MTTHGVDWYLVGIIMSILTPTLLSCWNWLYGHAYSAWESTLFRFVSVHCGVQEHRFENVNNIAAMTRILVAAGLTTGRYVWMHDANAASGDYCQVGVIRLPCKSYFFWFLSLLSISHYVWVKSDASTIVITGRIEIINTLVNLSSCAANRVVNQTEVDDFHRQVFDQTCFDLSHIHI